MSVVQTDRMTAPDYATLIDAETWDFIRRTDSYYPPETATFSVDRQRDIYDTMCRAFFQGYPAGVTATDRSFGGVPCRLYPGAGGTVVYFHGGGFVVGGLHSHDDVCAEIRSVTGLTVVSVDYRLCPEHPHPAAYDDSVAATKAVYAEFGGPLVLAGDSAGGNLAAAVAASVGRNGGCGVVGQVLIYPGLGGDMNAGSYMTHAKAPMLSRDDVIYYMGVRFGLAPGDTTRPDDVTATPLLDRDFSGLPPTLAIAAECDPLSDDCAAYAGRIAAAGGKARAVMEPGLVHGYLRARTTVGRAQESFDRITGAIAAMARGEWA